MNLLHFPALWIAVGAICLTDTAWSLAIGLTLSDYGTFLIGLCVLLGLTGLLRGKQRNPRLAVATEIWALWMLFAVSGNILPYLAATLDLPLQDEAFARLDRIIGFQWISLFNFVIAHAVLGRFLSICYASLLPEILVLSIFLSFAGLDRRIRDFFWIVYIAIALTGALSSLLPAEGAFQYFGFPGRSDWIHDFRTLRTGSGLQFLLPNMIGLVQFPSFHTVLPLLVIYVTWGTGFAGWLFASWNMIMLATVPPIGGHYLVDMVGGAGVLMVAILIRRGISRIGRTEGSVLGTAFPVRNSRGAWSEPR